MPSTLLNPDPSDCLTRDDAAVIRAMLRLAFTGIESAESLHEAQALSRVARLALLEDDPTPG